MAEASKVDLTLDERYSPSRKSWLKTSSPSRYDDTMLVRTSFVIVVSLVLMTVIGIDVDVPAVAQPALAFGYLVFARYETFPSSKIVSL